MYINIKSKYKKILWLIIGFLIACSFINTVHAGPSSYSFDSAEQERVNIIWNDIGGKTMQSAGFTTTYENSTYIVDDTKILNKNDYPYLSVRTYSSGAGSPYSYYHEYTFIDDIENLTWNNQIWSYMQRYRVNNNYKYHLLTITVDTRDNSIINRRGAFYLNGNYIHDFMSYYSSTTATDFLNFDLYKNNNNLFISNSFTYSILPSYLNGYTKITLTTDDKYYMLSGLSSGSVFIPIESFNSSGGRLSYYDNDLSSQPYTSYIQDYTITADGLYARQDFNLNDYYGADFVMFSKYIYLEGDDDITYDIWVPNDITYSDVTITPNESGGNDFEFQYKDSNGDIQNQTTVSVDLTPPQPLLSDVFNKFTTNYYGLSSIILSPISFLESLNSATCTPINIPNPIGSTSITLPCMTPVYQQFGGDFFTLYQTITTGFIAYYVGLGYFNLIKGLKDPSDDRIEVIHL